MRMHLPLPIDARHFDRWLDLFEQTARELFSEPIAWYFIERAQRCVLTNGILPEQQWAMLCYVHEIRIQR